MTIRWKDYSTGQPCEPRSLPVLEFIRRLLMHVLPARFIRVRYCGLYANRAAKQELPRCRELLGLASASARAASAGRAGTSAVSAVLVASAAAAAAPSAASGATASAASAGATASAGPAGATASGATASAGPAGATPTGATAGGAHERRCPSCGRGHLLLLLEQSPRRNWWDMLGLGKAWRHDSAASRELACPVAARRRCVLPAAPAPRSPAPAAAAWPDTS